MRPVACYSFKHYFNYPSPLVVERQMGIFMCGITVGLPNRKFTFVKLIKSNFKKKKIFLTEMFPFSNKVPENEQKLGYFYFLNFLKVPPRKIASADVTFYCVALAHISFNVPSVPPLNWCELKKDTNISLIRF